MISIDKSTCVACGICSDVCPRHIPEVVTENGKKSLQISAERDSLCMTCGHCMAVCPNSAITVDAFTDRPFEPVTPGSIDPADFLQLIRQRRSIRNYKDKPVPRHILEQILQCAAHSPTGDSRGTNGVMVIDDREKLETLSKLLYAAYESLDKALQNPIGRFFVKRNAGARMFKTLQEFVMPGMKWYLKWYREGRSNEILRNCPVLVLFHSSVDAPMAAENCLLAAFHAVLATTVHGLGSCFNDLIPPMCNREKAIRSLLALPAGHEVYAGLTLGYPKYEFVRTIPRQLADVSYI